MFGQIGRKGGLFHRLFGVSITFKILGAVFAVLAVTILVAAWQTVQVVKDQEAHVIELAKERQALLAEEVQAAAAAYLRQAVAFSESKRIRDAVIARDRDALMSVAMPYWKALEKADPDHPTKVHFHIPPAVSLLRIWKPDKFGDDLSSFRKTVVDVLSNGSTIKGVESGRAGMAVRGIAPIRDPAGGIVGSVEVFGGLEKIVAGLAHKYGNDAALFRIDRSDVSLFKGGAAVLKIGGSSLVFSTKEAMVREFLDEKILEAAKKEAVFVVRGGTLVGVSPVTDYLGETAGLYATFTDLAFFRAAQASALAKVGINGILAFFFASLFIYFLAKVSLDRPIKDILGVFSRVRQGDLTARARIVFDDEMGRLAAGLNAMVEHLADMVGRIKTHACTLKQASEGLYEASQQAAASSTETSAQADEIALSARRNEERIASLAAANEKITATVREIAQSSVLTVEMIGEVSGQIGEASRTVSQLHEHFARIEEVIAFIRTIADQTNLLALNATIEAARAGESGKGFAVVAGEVKELARQTAEATNQIVTNIHNLREMVNASVEAINKVNNLTEPVKGISQDVSQGMHKNAEMANEISSMAAGIAASTQDSLRQLDGLREAMEAAARAAESVFVTSGQLKGLSKEMEGLIARFSV
ncbi:MAG: methyl-accepting chemotaxis protein [Deltaproteobacteria bacterium]